MPLPVVSVIPPSQTIFVGSSPNFTCTVEFDETVDIPVMVVINFGSATSDDRLQMESYILHKQVFSLDSVQAIHSSQEYVCHTVGGVLVPSSSFVLAQPLDVSDNVTIPICK